MFYDGPSYIPGTDPGTAFSTGPYSPTSFTANTLLLGNGTGSIQSSGITSTAAGNGLLSAAASNLTLGTGTFGTALTFTSANGNATFAGSVTSNAGQILGGNAGTFLIQAANNQPLNLVAPGTNASGVNIQSGSTGPITFKTNGSTLALTLDSSQNATFAGGVSITGTLQLGNAYAAGVVAATGTVDIKDSTGTVYHVLVHT